MHSYPMTFRTDVEAGHGTQSTWTAHSADHALEVAIPPEFAGPGGAMSPEDLFAQALTNCFLATFKVLAENSRVTFERLMVKGSLVVDKDEAKQPRMQSCHLDVSIAGPSDELKARRLVDKAVQSGFILNSVKTNITHELHFG